MQILRKNVFFYAKHIIAADTELAKIETEKLITRVGNSWFL